MSSCRRIFFSLFQCGSLHCALTRTRPSLHGPAARQFRGLKASGHITGTHKSGTEACNCPVVKHREAPASRCVLLPPKTTINKFPTQCRPSSGPRDGKQSSETLWRCGRSMGIECRQGGLGIDARPLQRCVHWDLREEAWGLDTRGSLTLSS